MYVCLKHLVHLTTVNAIIIPVDKGKYIKKNKQYRIRFQYRKLKSKFVRIINSFYGKNKITVKE